MEPQEPHQDKCDLEPVYISGELRPDGSWRRQQLQDWVGEPEPLLVDQIHDLHELLDGHHKAFCLEERERGETDQVTMDINTGDACPRKQPVLRMSFAVRSDVAKQLGKMQAARMIQPSSSSWTCPVVMVHKHDGTHCFYIELNAGIKPNLFCCHASTICLISWGHHITSQCWSSRLDTGRSAVENTAFTMPHGLCEFRVMPIGLTNVPGGFQRLMEKVLAGFNPKDGPAFVAVYIDNVLIFSHTTFVPPSRGDPVDQQSWTEVKPYKCHFIRQEIEYLGHVVTPPIRGSSVLFGSFLTHRVPVTF